MKRIFYLLAFLFATILDANAQEVAYTWANSIGGINSDISYSIATDAAGSVYLTGYYSGTIDLDPSAGVQEHISNLGTRDIFLAKYTTNGAYQWSYSFAGTGTDVSYRVAVDASGNIYIAGYFTGTLDLNAGGTLQPTLVSTAGSYDCFYAKYNSAGVLQYAKSFGGPSSDVLYDMDVVGVDEIYLIGYYYTSITVLLNSVSTTYNSFGGADVYFGRFNSGGATSFGTIGGTSSDVGYGIKGGANMYITGYFIGTSDFNPSAGVTSLTASGTSSDAFIAKYSTAASPVLSWVRQLGSGLSTYGYDITQSTSGDVYLTGIFQGTVNFNPAGTGVGAVNLTSAGGYDAFIARYFTDGTMPTTAYWAKAFGGNSSDYCRGIYTDGSSNSYISGYFYGTAGTQGLKDISTQKKEGQ